MCTAASYKTKDFYFGRTLDYEFSYGDEIVVLPREYPLRFRHCGALDRHYAIIGMAYVAGSDPLFYDGINEKGLGMAGLNFVGNAHYFKPVQGFDNVAQFEFIPWILSRCATVREARGLLSRINLTDEAYSPQLPPAQLHWIIADRDEAITVESMSGGLPCVLPRVLHCQQHGRQLRAYAQYERRQEPAYLRAVQRGGRVCV